MTPKLINLFMWEYQHVYRLNVQILAERVFEALGHEIEPKALVVGVRRPDSENPNPVCVEPEDGEWPLGLFKGLTDSVEIAIRNHPLQKMFYGDAPSMRDKPENIRRDSMRREVQRALDAYDAEHSVRSFCGMAHPVDDYYVVPVVQIPQRIFQLFSPLREPIGDGEYRPYPSFIHAAMGELLVEATGELQRPDPGRSLGQRMRTADEIVRQAAVSFMRTPGIAIGAYYFTDLFSVLNQISSLMYEGTKGTGSLLLVNPRNSSIKYALRLAKPVPFREPRWVRKTLQMASGDLKLIADSEAIHGLGKLDAQYDVSRQDAFSIDFLDHYHWQLRCGTQVFLRSHYGQPKLPQERISHARFADNLARLFPESSLDDQQQMWELLKTAIEQDHGSLIVVASDAADEALRLAQQGSAIKPIKMTSDLLQGVSRIDGSILLDSHGICHAVGVILDGPANEECTPSRGSRFNSAIRYVLGAEKQRLAIVVSDDHTADIIPLLRPRVDAREIDRALNALESATLENYHQPRYFLDEHRFYLNAEQCDRANKALDRIEKLPREVGQIVIVTERFIPDPNMNESYYS